MLQRNLLMALLILFSLTQCSKDKNENLTPLPGSEETEQTEFDETCEQVVQNGLSITVDGEIDPSLMMQNMDAIQNYSNCMAGCSETEDLNCVMECLREAGLMTGGGTFSVTCYVTNTTTTSITFKINAGTWFQPGSDDYQPMWCLTEISIEIEAGETTTISVPVFCLNSNLSAPDEDSDFTICDKITTEGCMKDIFDILKNKDMKNLSYTQLSKVQDIIWACTSGESVDLAYLNNLPDL